MIQVTLERRGGDFGFEAKDEKGHCLQTDTSLENGGIDFGFRPMQLLLAALGSCSAIDLMTILKKQKQRVDIFRIEIQGEREKDVIPSLWKQINVRFYLSGMIDPDKAEKAATLSMEKYCSVTETLRRAGAAITWETVVNTDQL
jgi:putative redox protein